VMDVFGARMISRRFDHGIETRLYQKDLRTVLDTASEVGQELPAGAVILRQIEKLMDEGRGRDDFAALIDML